MMIVILMDLGVGNTYPKVIEPELK